MNSAPEIVVESIVFAARGRDVRYHVLRATWDTQESPEDLVFEENGVAAGPDTYVHSTSWRLLAPRRIALTYAVIPTAATHDWTTRWLIAPESASTAPPQPQNRAALLDIDEAEVASHALNHLAWLVRSNPSFVANHCRATTGEFWNYVGTRRTEPAGQLFAPSVDHDV